MAKVTIYTIAEELNMTPSMVSRAFNPDGKINEEKRKLVLETAKKYGFLPNKFASRLSMGTIRIGVLINSKFKVNTDKMLSGIKSAFSVLKDYKLTYEAAVLNDSENKTEEYEKVLEKYADFDGIILTGLSADCYTEMINRLYKKNSNVVQVQAINENANYLFASKHNESVASQLAAELLHNCLKWKNRKNVLLFTGGLESKLHLSAANAFKAACDEYGMNFLECVDMKDSDEYFKNIISEVFRKYAGNIDAIYITSGISMPLCEYLEKEGLDIPFVAFDTYDEIKSYMKKGIISATISQNVTNQMEKAFELLVRHIIEGQGIPKTVYTDTQLVLKSNMHQFD